MIFWSFWTKQKNLADKNKTYFFGRLATKPAEPMIALKLPTLSYESDAFRCFTLLAHTIVQCKIVFQTPFPLFDMRNLGHWAVKDLNFCSTVPFNGSPLQSGLNFFPEIDIFNFNSLPRDDFKKHFDFMKLNPTHFSSFRQSSSHSGSPLVVS